MTLICITNHIVLLCVWPWNLTLNGFAGCFLPYRAQSIVSKVDKQKKPERRNVKQIQSCVDLLPLLRFPPRSGSHSHPQFCLIFHGLMWSRCAKKVNTESNWIDALPKWTNPRHGDGEKMCEKKPDRGLAASFATHGTHAFSKVADWRKILLTQWH